MAVGESVDAALLMTPARVHVRRDVVIAEQVAVVAAGEIGNETYVRS